jgi:oligopeptide transport system permease protein
MKRLLRDKTTVLGLLVLIFISIMCFLFPMFSSQSWDTMDFNFEAAPPSFEHWFGVDEMGRDLFSRVLYGGRISLTVGIVTTLVSGIFGVTLGACAGYFGGIVDTVIMRLVDLLYSLPSYFIILLVMVFFDIKSIYALFFVLGLFQWLGMARMVRGQILSLKERDYIVAVQSCGATNSRILFHHLVPNSIGVIVVYATLTVPGIMLQEAFLSFIGIGFQATGTDGISKPVASWGALISEGAKSLETAPWLLWFPAVAFSVTLLAINFVGDGLRDILDPSLKTR